MPSQLTFSRTPELFIDTGVRKRIQVSRLVTNIQSTQRVWFCSTVRANAQEEPECAIPEKLSGRMRTGILNPLKENEEIQTFGPDKS